MSSDSPVAEVAIQVNGLGKSYQVFDSPAGRLVNLLFPRVQRYHKEYWALRGVDLTIRRGETVGIVGRNGSGKSTLLQMVCGTLNPSEGGVQVHGRVAALLELGAGFNPEFSGRDNVYLSASLYGVARAEVERKFAQIESFADIGDFIDQPVKTYSSGMLVRLAFAVIAHVDADILVVDEALAVGDAYFVQKCMRFLREFAERGTLLFVSHDTDAVVNLCDKAVLLNSGRVERIGSPRDVADYYLAMLHSKDSPGQKERFQLSGAQGNDFGTGAGRVVSAHLCDAAGRPLLLAKGGESVVLHIVCEAIETIHQPLVGFVVRDRLGQSLFAGSSGAVRTLDGVFKPGEAFDVQIAFELPLLNLGDYSISAALGEGSLEKHTHYHWAHDVTVFKCAPDRVFGGLMRVEMKGLELSSQPLRIEDAKP